MDDRLRFAAGLEAQRWLRTMSADRVRLAAGLAERAHSLTRELPPFDPDCDDVAALRDVRAWSVWHAAVAAEVLGSNEGHLLAVDVLAPVALNFTAWSLDEYRLHDGLPGQTPEDEAAALNLS